MASNDTMMASVTEARSSITAMLTALKLWESASKLVAVYMEDLTDSDFAELGLESKTLFDDALMAMSNVAAEINNNYVTLVKAKK